MSSWGYQIGISTTLDFPAQACSPHFLSSVSGPAVVEAKDLGIVWDSSLFTQYLCPHPPPTWIKFSSVDAAPPSMYFLSPSIPPISTVATPAHARLSHLGPCSNFHLVGTGGTCLLVGTLVLSSAWPGSCQLSKLTFYHPLPCSDLLCIPGPWPCQAGSLLGLNTGAPHCLGFLWGLCLHDPHESRPCGPSTPQLFVHFLRTSLYAYILFIGFFTWILSIFLLQNVSSVKCKLCENRNSCIPRP